MTLPDGRKLSIMERTMLARPRLFGNLEAAEGC